MSILKQYINKEKTDLNRCCWDILLYLCKNYIIHSTQISNPTKLEDS